MPTVSQYRDRVQFWNTVTVPDPANGDQNATTVKLLETWANVKPLRGYRALHAGQILNGKPYVIECRNRKDIMLTEDLHIRHNGRRFTVHSVVETKDGDALEITATEIT